MLREAMFCILFGTLICTAIWIVNKINSKRKKKFYTISIILVLLIVFSFGVFYIENLFYTFASPKNAFEYEYGYEINEIIEGTETAIVLADETTQIYVKSEGGWKFPTKKYIKYASYETEGIISIVYGYESTDDNYICISAGINNELNLSDNNNSTFICHKDGPFNGKTIVEYYAYIGRMDEDYVITINEVEYKLSEFEVE